MTPWLGDMWQGPKHQAPCLPYGTTVQNAKRWPQPCGPWLPQSWGPSGLWGTASLHPHCPCFDPRPAAMAGRRGWRAPDSRDNGDRLDRDLYLHFSLKFRLLSGETPFDCHEDKRGWRWGLWGIRMCFSRLIPCQTPMLTPVHKTPYGCRTQLSTKAGLRNSSFPIKSMLLHLHWCDRDLGVLIHPIPSPLRVGGSCVHCRLCPPSVETAKPGITLLRWPCQETWGQRPRWRQGLQPAMSSACISSGTTRRPAGCEGLVWGRSTLPPAGTAPAAPGGTAQPHRVPALQQYWGPRLRPSRSAGSITSCRGTGRGAAATRRCLLHLKPPGRVLSPLSPPARGWPPRGHSGEVSREGRLGWGGAEPGPTAATPGAGAGCGGLTGCPRTTHSHTQTLAGLLSYAQH